eukprot:scaffold306719_cov33-Tisochrysis_lutea.AAC.3
MARTCGSSHSCIRSAIARSESTAESSGVPANVSSASASQRARLASLLLSRASKRTRSAGGKTTVTESADGAQSQPSCRPCSAHATRCAAWQVPAMISLHTLQRT